MRMLATNCPNCGGPLEEGKCTYCGTQVRMANEIEIEHGWHNRKPVEVMMHIRDGRNNVTLLPFIGYVQEIKVEHSMYANPEVTIELCGTIATLEGGR